MCLSALIIERPECNCLWEFQFVCRLKVKIPWDINYGPPITINPVTWLPPLVTWVSCLGEQDCAFICLCRIYLFTLYTASVPAPSRTLWLAGHFVSVSFATTVPGACSSPRTPPLLMLHNEITRDPRCHSPGICECSPRVSFYYATKQAPSNPVTLNHPHSNLSLIATIIHALDLHPASKSSDLE
jgi:hypothetical protein